MKVCIVGTAPGSRLIGPYKDDSWEVWVCSAGNSQGAALPRVTKWFELHSIPAMMAPENASWCPAYFEWLKAQTFPIYMQEHNEYIPQAIVFPYKTLTEEFGPNPKKKLANWFTSTVAWMLAFAIRQMREGDEISVFGVDMAATEEHYGSQKAGCQRFIEIAQQKGIKVTIPYESCLGKTFPLYGYAEATPMGRKLQVRHDEISRIKQQLDGQIRSQELQRAFFEGALEGVNYDLRTWTDGMDAELDDDSQQAGMMNALKQGSGFVEKPMTLTGDFVENSNGVFTPGGIGGPAPAAQPAETVTVDSTGAKHYGMKCEPVKIGHGGEAQNEVPLVKSRRKKSANGLSAEG